MKISGGIRVASVPAIGRGACECTHGSSRSILVVATLDEREAHEELEYRVPHGIAFVVLDDVRQSQRCLGARTAAYMERAEQYVEMMGGRELARVASS